GDIEEIEVVNANFILMANLQQASTSGTQAEKAPVYDSDGSTELLEPTTEPQPVQQNNSNVIFADSSMDHSRGIVEQHPATVDETQVAKFVRDFKSLAKEADESLDKNKVLEYESNRLLRVVVSQDILSIVQNNFVVDSSNLQNELESYNEMQQNIEWLKVQLGDLKGQSMNTQCASNTIDPLSRKLYDENLSLEVDKYVPSKHVKTSVGTKQITLSKPHVNTKKDVNFNSNGLSSTRVESTAKTKRPQPRSNTKNDRVPSVSKSSCITNKEVEVEEHYRNLLLSKNQKHMSSECNNIKLAIWNDKSEVVCTLLTLNVSLTPLLGTQSILGWAILYSDLEVAFRRNTCSVRNLDGVDLSRYINRVLVMVSTLSHLNFDIINELAKDNLITSLPKFKYLKDHLCPSCEQGKSKKSPQKSKPILNSKKRLHLLYMDLYRPVRVESINRNRYVLVIVEYYSRYTWVHFLRSKDEAPQVIKTFLKKIQVLLHSVIIVRTNNRIEFTNQVLKAYFDKVGISHQTSAVKTPQQNGVVERRNQTLVEAARTMLIFSCASLFLWAEAIAIAALCYPKNYREDIRKLGAKGNVGFFLGYSTTSCAYRVYNQRTKKIMEMINVAFDELSAMAFG
ncbi:retrovirus-related pol polyprotein from transposon TNT 1-94, partial [Tanacetum coccineum]